MDRSRKYEWVFTPPTPKFTPEEKAKIISEVKAKIADLPKISSQVSRINIRSNRIYLYEKVEQFHPEGAVFIKPLIDGKYVEYPYARITLQDTECKKCTADWQRHNDLWMSLYKGTLIECLESIEKDNMWWQIKSDTSPYSISGKLIRFSE